MTSLRYSLVGALLIGAVIAGPAAAKLGSCNDPIVLGTTLSETGPFSTLADKWRKLTEVFAEEVNKSGGIMVKACNKKVPVKFVIYDDQSVPATAVSLYEKMATVDNVDFFVGPDWSSMGGPVPPIGEKHKIPMVTANIATPALYDRGLKYFWGTPFPVVPRWSERYFDMLSKVNPKPQSIFFVTHDNPVMKGISGFWTKKAEAQGMKLVGNETFSPDLKDFTAMISKIRAAKPDIVYIASFDGASVPLVQQMRQLKVKGRQGHRRHDRRARVVSRHQGRLQRSRRDGDEARGREHVRLHLDARPPELLPRHDAGDREGGRHRPREGQGGALQGHLQVAGRRHRVRRAGVP
jgi:branched-chain amino acid transport system substrate-binding protein